MAPVTPGKLGSPNVKVPPSAASSRKPDGHGFLLPAGWPQLTASAASATLPRRCPARSKTSPATTIASELGVQAISEVPTQIGRAHVWTPVTNAHLVCRLLLEKKKNHNNK